MTTITGRMTDAAARAGQSAASRAAATRSLQCAWECAGTGCARGWRSVMIAIPTAGMGAAPSAQWKLAAHVEGLLLTPSVEGPGTGARQEDVGMGSRRILRNVTMAAMPTVTGAAAPARSSVDGRARHLWRARQTNALLEDAETRFGEARRSATTATL